MMHAGIELFLMCPKLDCVLGSDRFEKDVDERFNPKVCTYCGSKLEEFPNNDKQQLILSSRNKWK